jgi:hypothetical protein
MALLDFVKQHGVTVGRRCRSHLPVAGRDRNADVLGPRHRAGGALGQLPEDGVEIGVLLL